jgi:hypothetical protein
MKDRNPKSENRRKSEGRNPNCNAPRPPRKRTVGNDPGRRWEPTCASAFGFRPSDFLRISAFGFRISPLALSLLAAHSAAAATTNAPGPDTIPPLRPPHGEIPSTFWEQHSSLVILAVACLVVLVCAGVWFLTRPKPPLTVPPADQARRALEPLRQQAEDGRLLSRVSQILRHYVTAAFDLSPEELTTTEFCRAIADHARIGPELSAALSDFLRLCDHDKFSPPAPVPPLSAVARALQLIEQSQVRLAEEAKRASQLAGSPNATRLRQEAKGK